MQESPDQDKIKIEESVVQAQSGVQEGFEYLWNYFAPRIKSYIYCRINEKHDADDLVSDIFIRAFGKINSFDPSKATFSTWIFTITRNVLIDYFGSGQGTIQWLDTESMQELERQGTIQTLYSQLESTIDELEERAINHENLIAKIEEVLDSLPAQYAEIIRLKFFFGMDTKEISELKSKTQGNIRVALHRAITQAQNTLKKMNI